MKLIVLKSAILIFFLIFIMPTSLLGKGKGLDSSNNRIEYFLFLKDEGFSPKLDNVGDIIFVMDDQKYYLLIYEEKAPLYVQIQNSGIKLEKSNFNNQEVVLKAINNVNSNQRVTKLVIIDGILYCRNELLLQNATALRYIFYRSMKCLNESVLEFKEEYNRLVSKQAHGAVDSCSVKIIEV